jgi:aspartyl-tRNA(Asn)/glutamyl-tRNA(Gln) amidotransferase subunit C
MQRADSAGLYNGLMSTISQAEVARLAVLARIELDPEELTRLAGELDVIVEAIARVSQVATADVPATSHPIIMTNVFRADVPQDPLPVEQALAGAPSSEGGRFAVPQILGEG